MLVVNKGVSVTTSGTALLATGTATGREYYINGSLVSASGIAVQIGAASVVDSKSLMVIGETGRISSKGYGIDIKGGGFDLVNHGTIEAALTAIATSGTSASIVNNGLVSSASGSAVSASGTSALVVNNGSIKAAGQAVILSSTKANLTNNGEIVSLKAHALQSSGAAAILTNHGSVKAETDAIRTTGSAVKLTNDGALTALKGSAILASGSAAIITNIGTITAAKDAIVLSGDDGKVTNSGLIMSAAYAIRIAADDAIVTNYKTIKAGGGVTMTGAGETVANYGTIAGTVAALATIDFSKAVSSSLHNYGLITSKSIAFLGGTGTQSLFNSGTITGNIDLGTGNDYFDGTGGKVNGTVSGGSGNDVYVISDATIKLLEKSGGGTDLVKSTVSFTLGDHFENLTLNGTAGIKATGNGLANQIHGNSGANTIDGKAGNDVLWGHRGADILTGGTGIDQFVFATKDGKDTITDFTATGSAHDILDLTGLASITDYKDLVANHMRQVGSDVLIDGLNGDSILLKGAKMATLYAGDFWF
jgi:Ca2+-binding RTX toxin-like protein